MESSPPRDEGGLDPGASSPPAVIELRGVAKQCGAVQALRGVDLAMAQGEVHALVGENGAGKSTLVKMLAGVHRPDAGSILMGRTPSRFPSRRFPMCRN